MDVIEVETKFVAMMMDELMSRGIADPENDIVRNASDDDIVRNASDDDVDDENTNESE